MGFVLLNFSFLYSVSWSLFVPFLLVIVLSVLLWFTASDYPFGIFELRLLITPLVSCRSLCSLSFSELRFWLPLWYHVGHCVVCPSLSYSFWLPLWHHVGHCVVCPSLSYSFWLPLWYHVGHCVVCPSLSYASDCPFGIMSVIV